jgi:ABC-2 type transport system ATP-binding protein
MSLVISNVSKRYGKSLALHGFSAELTRGVYALLGPNGAGKTTLFHIITGLIQQNEGAVLWEGEDPRKLGAAFLDRLGFLPQAPRFYKNYRAYEFLEYMAAVKGLPKSIWKERIQHLLHEVNLSDERGKKIGSFSGGMRQRLGIAQALLNDPAILILDEPTAGLDPKERIRFRNLISGLGNDRIVILATHIVSDVEYIANEVLIIRKGEKLYQAPVSDLLKQISGSVWEVCAGSEREVQRMMRSYPVSNAVRREDGYFLRVVSGEQPLPAAVPLSPTLEDMYLHCFGERGEP